MTRFEFAFASLQINFLLCRLIQLILDIIIKVEAALQQISIFSCFHVVKTQLLIPWSYRFLVY